MHSKLSNVDPEVVWFTFSMLALAVIGVAGICICAYLGYLSQLRPCG
jgi:hypothetical protein